MKFGQDEFSIHKGATIGSNVEIGRNVIIYDNVEIGDNSIVCENCIIGEPTNSYYRDRENYEQQRTVIGDNSLIRSHTIIYSGSEFGSNLNTGHHVTIRENTRTGDYVSFGSYCDIQGDCDIGSYSRFHSYVNIGKQSVIGSFVFMYPFVVLTNDPTPPSEFLKGVTVEDYSQISAHSTLLPGTHVGKHCLIAAGTTVGGPFQEDSFIAGNPGKRKGRLSKMPFFNKSGKRNYPWPKHFERGMPWEGLGYDKWLTDNA